MNAKLNEGQNVKVNIPFIYTIGEEGPITGKVLETIEDCEDEARAELAEGIFASSFHSKVED